MALVLLVLVTDAAKTPTLSFYLLLMAIPAIVVAGLASVEEILEGAASHRRAIGLLHALTLVLVLVSAAVRAPLRAEGSIPAAGVSAVIVCVAVFAIQVVLALLPSVRRVRTAPLPEPTEATVT